jgi:hypothetical protein
MMALQKALEGIGRRWPRRAIKSFQNLRKNKKRSLCECAFGFPLLSFKGLRRAVAVGFACLGIPVCLTPVFSPRVWTLRGFPGSAGVDPNPGRCTTSTRRPPFIKRCSLR